MSGSRTTGISSSTGDHAGLRAGREAVGWSRTVISDMTGMSVAVVARVETKGGTPVEVGKYRDALKIALGEVVAPNDEEGQTAAVPVVTKSPAVTGFLERNNAIRLTDWEGLRRGDVVKLEGEKGTFRFLFYHEDDHQRYVEVSGPLVRYRDQTRGSQLRSVRPERIIRTRGRRPSGPNT